MGLKKVEKPIRKKTKLKKDGRIILEESFLQDKNLSTSNLVLL
jgi:hypothetical protein